MKNIILSTLKSLNKLIRFKFPSQIIVPLTSSLVIFTAIFNFVITVSPLINDTNNLTNKLANIRFDIFVVIEEVFAYILLISGLALLGRSRIVWSICILNLCILVTINFINYRLIYTNLHYYHFIKIFTLLVLIISYRHFRHQFYMTYHFVFISAFIIFAMFYGTFGSYVLRTEFTNIHSFADALYFTIVTYSTVGYGDIAPITSTAKYFVISMILIGLIMFTSGVTLLAFTLNNKIKDVLLHLNRGKVAMTNHIIFCGYGVFTKILIERYRKSNQQFIVLDRPDNLDLDHQRLQEENSLIITPYPGNTQAMTKARLTEAKMVIIGYESDADTIFSIMAVVKFLQDTQPRPQIIARITYEENIAMAKSAGADTVIAPQVLVADAIAKMTF